MAHQAGFDNVVASLGTALTPGQVALLTRYASRIALAYDVDPAGEKAGTLGVTALAGLIGQLQGDDSGVKLEDVRVVRLPDWQGPGRGRPRGHRRTGSGAVAKAKPLVEYLIGHHADRFDLKTSTGRIGFVEAVMPAIRDIADPLRRDEALQEVRHVSGVEERVLRQVLDRRIAAAARSVAHGHGGPNGGGEAATRISAEAVLASPDALPIGDILRAVTPVEAELLRLLLLVPDQQLRVVDELGPDQLPSTLARELYRAIVLQRAPDDHGVHPPFDGAALLLAVDDETASLARALYAKPGPEPRTLTGTPARVRGDPTAPRARGRPAARAQRLQRGRDRRGRARQRQPSDRAAASWNAARSTKLVGRSTDAREETRLLARPTVAAVRRPTTTRPITHPESEPNARPGGTHVRRSARQATRGRRPVPAASRQGRSRGGQARRAAAVPRSGSATARPTMTMTTTMTQNSPLDAGGRRR